MGHQQLQSILGSIRRLVGNEPSECSDRDLLERFLSQQDEEAFSALLRRHGPMVLGVCRRVLRDPNDVDDAFQAAFLILVQKAGSIKRRNSLGSWLYGVSYRIAVRAKTNAVKRRLREKEASEMRPTKGFNSCDREFRELVDEELQHLPDKYRAPIVLCCLEGRTIDEAAQELKWLRNTVKGRLARGRELLRRRLASRGLATTVSALLALLAVETAPAAVPPRLQRLAVNAVTQTVFGKCATTIPISESARRLAKEVKSMMLMRKVKVAVLAVSIALAGGAIVLSLPSKTAGRSSVPVSLQKPPATNGRYHLTWLHGYDLGKAEVYRSRIEAVIDCTSLDDRRQQWKFRSLRIEKSSDDDELRLFVDTAKAWPEWLPKNLVFTLNDQGAVTNRPKIDSPQFGRILTEILPGRDWMYVTPALAGRPCRFLVVHDLDSITVRFKDAVVHEVEIPVKVEKHGETVTITGTLNTTDPVDLGRGEMRLAGLRFRGSVKAVCKNGALESADIWVKGETKVDRRTVKLENKWLLRRVEK
ncbi:MAG: hypothetical protein KatS3mg105_0396 [Gemmatales bacterium]|nr:MAG: hypothetical protein KatS3mg105_0396 [Gemmatales bacterium]